MAKLAFIFKEHDFVKDEERIAYRALQKYNILHNENIGQVCVIINPSRARELLEAFWILHTSIYFKGQHIAFLKNKTSFTFGNEQSAYCVVSLII